MHLLPAGQRVSISPFLFRRLFCVRSSRKRERKAPCRARERKKNRRGRKVRFDLCLRGDSCRRACVSPAFKNLSTRKHECPLASAPKCVRQHGHRVIARSCRDHERRGEHRGLARMTKGRRRGLTWRESSRHGVEETVREDRTVMFHGP